MEDHELLGDRGMSEKVVSIRRFETGATRDTDEGKLDYEGFNHPVVDQRYAEYMHKHRVQPDGALRSADNWQKGIPKDQYAKSLQRHNMDFRLLHRGYPAVDGKTGDAVDIEEALCAILFNAKGYLLEILKERGRACGSTLGGTGKPPSAESSFSPPAA